MNICVICSGNICRSPFVEYVLKRELSAQHNIYSSGTLGITGSLAYQVCIELGPEYNLDLSSHKSQAITPEIIEKTDLFIGMTRQHCRVLVRDYKVHPDKVRLISDFLPVGKSFPLGMYPTICRGDNIPDPMGCPDKIVKPVLDVLEKATMELVNFIKSRA